VCWCPFWVLGVFGGHLTRVLSLTFPVPRRGACVLSRTPPTSRGGPLFPWRDNVLEACFRDCDLLLVLTSWIQQFCTYLFLLGREIKMAASDAVRDSRFRSPPTRSFNQPCRFFPRDEIRLVFRGPPSPPQRDRQQTGLLTSLGYLAGDVHPAHVVSS